MLMSLQKWSAECSSPGLAIFEDGASYEVIEGKWLLRVEPCSDWLMFF